MTAVRSGDPAYFQVLGQSKHRSIDEAEPEILIFPIEVEDSRIAFLGKVSNEEGAIDQTFVEGSLSLSAEALPQQIIDLGDYRGGHDEPTDLSFKELVRGEMPEIPAVVVRVENAGVEEDGH
jgi:hypothetical protein